MNTTIGQSTRALVPSPERISQVAEALANAYNQSGRIDALVKELEIKLASVTLPEPASAQAENKTPNCGVQLAAKIHEFAGQAAASADSLESILRRIEL